MFELNPLECALNEAQAYRNQVDALSAENAKLREERREYQTTIDSLVDECADHKAENAKLREQVDYMTPLALYAASERERDRMRELGIEVPA